MLPGEIPGIHFPAPANAIPITENFCMIQSSDFPNLNFDGFSYIPVGGYEITSLPSRLGNNSTSSTSDEGDDQQLKIIDDRKKRRMISNRESARRSRMRKQKHLDELWSQVVRLCTENHDLIEKLNHLTKCQERLLQENARLKEEASDFRQMLTDLQIGSPFTIPRELEEVPSNF